MLLHPDGEFLPKAPSTTGLTLVTRDDDGNVYDAIAWCGAEPSPVHEEPIGFEDAEETKPIYQEGSRGILAGYSNNGELWNSIGDREGE